MPTRDDPAARTDHRRHQCPLVRIDPDHAARPIGRDQHVRRARAPSPTGAHRSPSSPPGATVETAGRPTTSRWTQVTRERSYQVRPVLEDTNRGRHFVSKTPRQRARAPASQTPVQPSTLREPSPASSTTDYNTGIIRAGGGGHGGTCQVLLRPLIPRRTIADDRIRSSTAHVAHVDHDRPRRPKRPNPRASPSPSPALQFVHRTPYRTQHGAYGPTPRRVDGLMWTTFRPRARRNPRPATVMPQRCPDCRVPPSLNSGIRGSPCPRAIPAVG